MQTNIQLSLEPNMRLHISGSKDPNITNHFSKIPFCNFLLQEKKWVVKMERMSNEQCLTVYTHITNVFHKDLIKLGHKMNVNQMMLDHMAKCSMYYKQRNSELKKRVTNDWSESLDKFGVQPYDHQIDAVCHWIDNNGRSILGHEMGTGKTISSILAINSIQAKRVVIFTPASVMMQWEREIKRLLPNYTLYIYPNITGVGDVGREILLVSYARAEAYKKSEAKATWKSEFIICDECHYIKNPKAKRTKAILQLAKTTDYFLGLSGTPIINRPVDLFPPLKIVAPSEFDNWYQFTKTYCNGHMGKFGYVADGLSRKVELHSKLSRHMHRVTKDDCLDLPPKMRTVIPCKVSFSMDDYDSFQEAFTDLGVLKTESAIDWIKDFLASNDEKLVVFTYHVNVAEHIFYMLTCVDNNNLHKQVDLLTGSTTKQDRDAYISRFQNPKSDKRILILTLGVGSTGLNLQKANNVLMVETSFSPMEMLQAEDRVHRNGQTKSCSINYLVAENTFDNKLFSLLEKKMGMSNAVVDGDFNNDLNVFEELKKEIANG